MGGVCRLVGWIAIVCGVCVAAGAALLVVTPFLHEPTYGAANYNLSTTSSNTQAIPFYVVVGAMLSFAATTIAAGAASLGVSELLGRHGASGRRDGGGEI